MYNFSTLLTLASVATTALTASTESQHYRLVTKLKPHQRAKISYNNLYVTTYHTGAGLNDATFVKNQSSAAVGYLNGTGTDNVQSFELPGSETPWSMYMDSTQVAYAGWQPVRINLGYGGSGASSHGFFINSTGLQWNSAADSETASSQFNGWVLCEWWHGVPQLFFRLAGFNTPLPKSCADIYLEVEYIEA